MVWNEIIACYLFLAGLGAGAFFYAALLGFKKPEAKRTRAAGMAIGLAAVAIGTLLLVIDAEAGFHHPLRFFHLFANLSSVMTWGTIFLSVFLVVAFIDLVFMCVKKESVRALDIVGGVLSVCVACYTGALLGVSQVYPLWNLGVLPVLFAVSAASTGFATVELVSALAFKGELRDFALGKKAAQVLPVLEALLILALLIVTGTAGGVMHEAGAATVAGILSGRFAPVFWICVVVLGIALPLFAEVSGVVSASKAKRAAEPDAEPDGATEIDPKACRATNALEIASKVGIIIGGFALRYLVVLAAVPVLL